MTIDSLKQLYERDLDALRNELDLYTDESQLWILQGEISNTAGNLMVHLCGNLQHFIGATLGQTGYIRDRPAEFTVKNVPRAEIEAQIAATKEAVLKTLDMLSTDDLEKIYPIRMWGREITTNYFLIHLSGHLMYHLGQINYHRRLLTSS